MMLPSETINAMGLVNVHNGNGMTMRLLSPLVSVVHGSSSDDGVSAGHTFFGTQLLAVTQISVP
jgi:hypothetical protein